MKKMSKFFITILALYMSFTASYAEYLGPGKYYGVVVFDRWDGCLLYRGVYITYISEATKEQLRRYTGQLVQINATKVYQPINPGDGLIREFEYLGSPPEKPEKFSVAGVKLKSLHAFKDGEKPSVIMEILNVGKTNQRILSEELAPTLLTKQPLKLRALSPSDGPSIALLTRLSIWNMAKYGGKGSGVTQGIPYSWNIGKADALPRELVLKPGEKKQIRITFDLPEGEYEFLCGYGGGHYGRKCIASNLIYFNVGKDSNGKIVECSSEVVNGLQLVPTYSSPVRRRPEVRPDGQPKLVIHFKNAGSKPFDIVEMAPLFLEVRDRPGYWRTFQHPQWDSSKIDTMFTFEPGHDESETEPVSAFYPLPPGKYLVRVSMAFDCGMSQKYKSNRIWTGLLRSNTVEITVPKDEGDSPLP